MKIEILFIDTKLGKIEFKYNNIDCIYDVNSEIVYKKVGNKEVLFNTPTQVINILKNQYKSYKLYNNKIK